MGVTTSRRVDLLGTATVEEKAAEVRTRLAEPAKYVFVERESCPKCGAHGPKALATLRSVKSGDGSRSRATRCRACGFRFTVIIEYRAFGG